MALVPPPPKHAHPLLQVPFWREFQGVGEKGKGRLKVPSHLGLESSPPWD